MDDIFEVYPERRSSKKDKKKKRLYRVYKRGGRFRTVKKKLEKLPCK